MENSKFKPVKICLKKKNLAFVTIFVWKSWVNSLKFILFSNFWNFLRYIVRNVFIQPYWINVTHGQCFKQFNRFEFSFPSRLVAISVSPVCLIIQSWNKNRCLSQEYQCSMKCNNLDKDLNFSLFISYKITTRLHAPF